MILIPDKIYKGGKRILPWDLEVKYLSCFCFTENPITQDAYGNTPIHYAAWTSQLEIVMFLVGFTDNPNIKNHQTCIVTITKSQLPVTS